MRDAEGNPLNRAHRQQFLLSGLVTCGCCGGRYIVMTKDRFGCSTRRGKGTCTNKVTISPTAIEARVLGALRSRMLTSALVEQFVRSFTEELAALQRDAAARQSSAERRAGCDRAWPARRAAGDRGRRLERQPEHQVERARGTQEDVGG